MNKEQEVEARRIGVASIMKGDVIKGTSMRDFAIVYQVSRRGGRGTYGVWVDYPNGEREYHTMNFAGSVLTKGNVYLNVTY